MKTKLYPGYFSRVLKFSFLFVLLLSLKVSAQSYSIFDPSDAPPGTPGNTNSENDSAPIETGVRFRVTQAGTIDAILFMQSASNFGTNTANLWDTDGNLISTSGPVTVAAGVGWRQIDLPAPVTLVPGTHYIASVYSPSGYYAAEQAAYGSGDIGADPVYGVGWSPTTQNGVYNFGSSGFPTNSFNSTNYFIDVVFTPFFPLPVSLTDFKANARDYDVNLSWFTSSEQNNKGFEVQRSSNGSDYSVLTFVNGAGESSSKLSYAFTDRNLVPGLYYYRLKQIDNDGRYKFSPVVTATIGRSSNIVLYNSFPNPVRTTGRINYVLPSTMNVTLSLVDLNGRVVKVLDRGLRQSGQNVATLDATTLMKGLYFYKLEVEGYETLVRRVVVQ